MRTPRPRIPLLCLAAALLSGCNVLAALGLKGEVVDRVPPEIPAELDASPVRILLFSKTAGYRHQEAIPACERAVREIAARRGWAVFATENAAVFNDEQLARFTVVFGNNGTGPNWTDDQKAAFRRYVEGGGAFVGVHGAGGTRDAFWAWYQRTLIGAMYWAHPISPQLQSATVRVENRDHPATRHLPETWERVDEWYSFEENPREKGVLVLATLDESSYEPKAFWTDLSMGGDHPIMWSHCVGRGRSFFFGGGHTGGSYAEPAYAKVVEGALAWAAGLDGSCEHPIAALP